MARRGRNTIKGLSKALDIVPVESVERIVDSWQRAGERSAADALGGSATISPNGNGPYPLVVKVDKIRTSRGSVSIVLYGSPAGFWSWLEHGVDLHDVRPRKRVTPSGRPPAMGGGLAHPIGGPVQRGMYPRQAWTKTVELADAELVTDVGDTLDEILEEVA